jgi:hypothetical protein
MREQWNRPVEWPLAVIVAVLVLASTPAYLSYRRREKRAGRENMRSPSAAGA